MVVPSEYLEVVIVKRDRTDRCSVLVGLGAFLLPVVGTRPLRIRVALRWGVDSRLGSSDPRRPDHPVGLS